LWGSLLTPALISFTRNTVAFTPSMISQWQYLHDSQFRITDDEGTLTGAWIDHPAADPFMGPCAGDATSEAVDVGTVVRKAHPRAFR
jgi:hypothetical protein